MTQIEVTSNVDEVLRGLARLRKNFRDPALTQAAKEIGRETLREYRRTTTTWHHKPNFQTLTEVRGGDLFQITGTDDEIYRYVDLGTRPHYILPRVSGNKLRFQTGYNAKTRPNSLTSYRGGKFGPVRFADAVLHPGTPPRNFTKLIGAIMSKKSVDIMLKYLDKWRKKKYV